MLVDPEARISGDRVAAAAATGPLIGRLVIVGEEGAQWTVLIDLSLVESESKQSSRGVSLRRSQKRRRRR